MRNRRVALNFQGCAPSACGARSIAREAEPESGRGLVSALKAQQAGQQQRHHEQACAATSAATAGFAADTGSVGGVGHIRHGRRCGTGAMHRRRCSGILSCHARAAAVIRVEHVLDRLRKQQVGAGLRPCHVEARVVVGAAVVAGRCGALGPAAGQHAHHVAVLVPQRGAR